MYQGLSQCFFSSTDDVSRQCEDDGLDFKGESGVIVDDVPMGVSKSDALSHIKLLVQSNDWSLRTIAPIEMKTGFGWAQAKPACSVAPLAATLYALGIRWRDRRIAVTLAIDLNGECFGAVDGAEDIAFGFHDLVAYAARTRRLCAGTFGGSGTLSTLQRDEVGSSCLSERRAIDIIAGRAPTLFMRFGDRVRMEAFVNGASMVGVIDQQVVAAQRDASSGHRRHA